jgi:hypothetical protein
LTGRGQASEKPLKRANDKIEQSQKETGAKSQKEDTKMKKYLKAAQDEPACSEDEEPEQLKGTQENNGGKRNMKNGSKNGRTRCFLSFADRRESIRK